MPAAISVTGLVKRYGDRAVVDGLDLEVQQGEVFAFLGKNGAGKTTTTEILEGYRTRDGGDVSVLGEDPATAGASWRAKLGIVLQESRPLGALTVNETLRLFAAYFPNPHTVDEVIQLVGLEEQANQRAGRLSGGQVRRLDVGIALIGRPELVFLDEPTTGFDPEARRQFWDVISGLRDLGTTVFLTTHYMDEAQVLADRVAVLRDGKIAALGTPAELQALRGDVEIRFALPHGVELAALPALSTQPRLTGGEVRVETTAPTADLAVLCSWAEARGLELPALTVERPTLEDVFLAISGETA
ncbi:MAG: ABC transporter ATP-binding protein [Actinobacteria bacterium]|nr:ABC transporter ATP-binding protein [Actinomycetota bacterium]